MCIDSLTQSQKFKTEIDATTTERKRPGSAEEGGILIKINIKCRVILKILMLYSTEVKSSEIILPITLIFISFAIIIMVGIFLGIWFKRKLSIKKSAQTSETTESDSKANIPIYDYPRPQEYEIIKIKTSMLYNIPFNHCLIFLRSKVESTENAETLKTINNLENVCKSSYYSCILILIINIIYYMIIIIIILLFSFDYNRLSHRRNTHRFIYH